MCGRFTLTASPTRIAEHFELEQPPQLVARYNVAPSQDVATLSETRGARTLSLRRWGLIPPWARDEKIGHRQINARSESVADKPAFRDALRRRRCLIPADGFYEWSGPAGNRQPYWIGLQDRDLFAFAGLWERWRDPQGATVESCAVLTSAANDRLRALHGRMPVVLPPERYALWLDEAVEAPDRALAAVAQHCCDRLRFVPVSDRVNDVRFDDPSCIERAEPPQPSLF